MMSLLKFAVTWLALGSLIPMPAFGQANDFCAGALALTNGVVYTENTSAATNGVDPLPACQNFFGRGVWFTFTPSANGAVTISTCGSDFDTVLQVYSGGCGALSAVACNDDNGPSCVASNASLIFAGTAGTTYWMLAGGFDGDFGNLQIVVTGPAGIILSRMNVSNGVFRFVVTGPASSNCVVQASTNLLNWQPVTTNLIGAGGTVTITDTILPGRPRRYYRALLL